MLSAFKGLEILTFAVEIEKNGQAFYQAVAGQIEDEATKNLFLDLAKEEAAHIVDFQGLMADVDDYQAKEEYSGEYMDYVKVLVDDHVFSKNIDVAQLAKTAADPLSALTLALRFEKDSILFFSELKRTVFHGHEGVIDELIAKEHGHVRRLAQLRQSYAK